MNLKRFAPWLFFAAFACSTIGVQAQTVQSAEALIKKVSTDVLTAAKADTSIKKGDISQVTALVNEKVLPYLDFERMTASAVGPAWRQTTPEQKKELETQFEILLVRTYAGALSQVTDQTVQIRQSRNAADAKEIVVRTEIKGQGDPIQLDYRLEQKAGGWKIYDVNVLGVWLVQNYRNTFAEQIGAKGIDGLISTLTAKNKSVAAK